MFNNRLIRELATITIVMTMGMIVLWTCLPDDWRKYQSVDYERYYKPVAKRLVSGCGLRGPSGALASWYPPGFPIFLAGVFKLDELTGLDEDISLKLFVLFCNSLSLILLYLLTERIAGTQAALIVGILWATYPFFLWLGKQPNSETPFFVFFLAAVYLVVRIITGDLRASVAFSAGLSVGLASMVRQAAAGYGVALAGYLLFFPKNLNYTRRCVLALALVAGNVLVVAPWEYAVYRVNGEKILLGRNLNESLEDGITFALKSRPDGSRIDVDDGVRNLMGRSVTNPRHTVDLGSYLKFLSEETQRDPATVLRFFALKARRAWFATDSHRLERLIASIQSVYLGATAFGLILCMSSQKPHLRRLAALVVVSTLYFWALTLLVVPILRYMVPAMSLLMIPAGMMVKKVLYASSADRMWLAQPVDIDGYGNLEQERELPIRSCTADNHTEPSNRG